MGWIALIEIVGLIFVLIHKFQVSEERKITAMSPDERAQYQQERADYWCDRESAQREQKALCDHGPLNPPDDLAPMIREHIYSTGGGFAL